MKQEYDWKFTAFGKHPAVKDYITLGESTLISHGIVKWVENGYAALTGATKSSPGFCSWRFWAKGPTKDSLICGIIRESSDKLGRPYPFIIIRTGTLRGWEDNWDLLPIACENLWVQIEQLAIQKFDELQILKAEMEKLRPPPDLWSLHSSKKTELIKTGAQVPYASIIDINQLNKQAADLANKKKILINLDRGSGTDKILLINLWHDIFKKNLATVPYAMFLGGALDKTYMVIFNTALSNDDFIQLWSVNSAKQLPSAIGTENCMDLLSLGTEPIPADKPGGHDIHYDPLFEELNAEIDKLSSPSAFETIDWEKIVRGSSYILEHKSKDIFVASYLAVALIYTRKQDGLAIGIKLIHDLIVNFWNELHPAKERVRGRLRSLEWWIVKTELAMKNISPGSVSSQQAAIMRDNLEKIEQLMKKYLDGAPSVSKLIKKLELLCQASCEEDQIIKNSPDQSLKQAMPKESFATASVTTELIVDKITSPIDAGRLLEGNMIKLREIAAYLWQHNPANPLVYCLNRQSIWMVVENMPPATENKTKIQPPDSQTIKSLFEMRNNGNSNAILKYAESKLSQYIFWFDLNRFVAEALLRLGDNFQKARAAVCRETVFFLNRFSGLEELSFANGMPFADSKTKDWIRSISFVHDRAEDNTPQQKEANQLENKIAIEVNIAKKLIKQGKLMDAMRAIQTGLMQASSSREKIIWRVLTSQMLLAANQVKIALPQMEMIIEDIDKYHLEEYEPDLTLRALKVVWTGLGMHTGEMSKTIKAEDISSRIARLDMVEAARYCGLSELQHSL